MLNVRLTSYRKLFCLARLRDCFRRTRQRGQESKVFFKATLQILNLNRKIFIASVEQSGYTRNKYIFLHFTFLSSYKTNRLHFAERLFSFKKRNKTKIVTKASVTMTWSLAVRVRIFLSCLDKQSLIDKSGNILFLLHLHTIGKKLIPSRGCGCESAHMWFCNHFFVSNLLQSAPPLLLKEIF